MLVLRRVTFSRLSLSFSLAYFFSRLMHRLRFGIVEVRSSFLAFVAHQ